MTIFSDSGFTRNYLEWLGVNFLLEGLEAVGRQRELTDFEDDFVMILEELNWRFLEKIYPGSQRCVPMLFKDLYYEDLWYRASAHLRGEFDPLDLIRHRDEEHPRGGCRFCAAEKKIHS